MNIYIAGKITGGEKKYRYFIAAYFGDMAMTEFELNAFLEDMADELGD